jgi:hypothetical protein
MQRHIMEDEGYVGGRRAAQDGKRRSEGPWLRSPGWLDRIQQGLLFLFILVVAGRLYCTDEADHLTMYQLPARERFAA